MGDFAYYFLCDGQREAPALGYSPLPLNLVKAGLRSRSRRCRARRSAGHDPSTCNNPTFDPKNPNSNLLAETAPQPDACDKIGAGPCGIAVPPAGGGGGTGGAGGGGGGGSGPPVVGPVGQRQRYRHRQRVGTGNGSGQGPPGQRLPAGACPGGECAGGG